MDDRISQTWIAIEAARANSSRSECEFPMNPPTTPDLIEQDLSRVTGMKIPLQLQESLLVFNGMDHQRGAWFADCGTLIPLSVEGIKQYWKSNCRQRAEAIAEGDEVEIDETWIPVIGDAIAHQTIFMDTRDGSLLCKFHASCFVEEFRYSNYLEFLNVVLKCIENDELFEWPANKQT